MDDTVLSQFVIAASVPRNSSHTSGTLDEANAILAAHPEVATANIHAAAILGNDEATRRFVASDPANATATGGPYGWDALTHLCFSRYLRLDRARSDGFLRTATILLDAGANPNTGWHEHADAPYPQWESAIYGAAGVAHDAALTRLLLARGADPNDDETLYHTPETYDNGALVALLESGKLASDSLAIMLIRKCDWHDFDGIKLLLDYGANPKAQTRFGGRTALHHAVLRDNHRAIIEVLLERGADPRLACDHGTAFAMAARRGRGDVLDMFEWRGRPLVLDGLDRLLAACARNQAPLVKALAAAEPELLRDLLSHGGELLGKFAANGNIDGLRHLLDLGVPVAAVWEEGDPYFGIAKNSTALHAAAWRAQHATVKQLIERGAPVDVRDARGRTPLALAVLACVDSYWKGRRSPESVEALLNAGASIEGVRYPSGYAAADDLIRRRIDSTG